MAISFANRFNADLLDQNYQLWRQDPAAVDSTWSAFFEGFELGSVQPKNGAVASQNGASAASTGLPAAIPRRRPRLRLPHPRPHHRQPRSPGPRAPDKPAAEPARTGLRRKRPGFSPSARNSCSAASA
ncbi:MAG: hypothetical protein WDN28_11335 [Chthoniobacter sp.]